MKFICHCTDHFINCMSLNWSNDLNLKYLNCFLKILVIFNHMLYYKLWFLFIVWTKEVQNSSKYINWIHKLWLNNDAKIVFHLIKQLIMLLQNLRLCKRTQYQELACLNLELYFLLQISRFLQWLISIFHTIRFCFCMWEILL